MGGVREHWRGLRNPRRAGSWHHRAHGHDSCPLWSPPKRGCSVGAFGRQPQVSLRLFPHHLRHPFQTSSPRKMAPGSFSWDGRTKP